MLDPREYSSYYYYTFEDTDNLMFKIVQFDRNPLRVLVKHIRNMVWI